MELTNLTPHEIVVVGHDGRHLLTLPPSGTVARVATTEESLPSLAVDDQEIPVVRPTMGDVEGLPEPQDDVIYVVSRLVAEAAPRIRRDLVCPGPLVRDDAGRPIGCRGLSYVGRGTGPVAGRVGPVPEVVIQSATSTNGRWGLDLVAPEGTELPAEGRLEDLGKKAGRRVFRHIPAETGVWTIFAGDAEVVEGTPATVAVQMGLQSYRVATILRVRPGGVWRSFGYKRRGSWYHMLTPDGRVEEVPAHVIARAMARPEACPEPPEPEENVMADALRRAGLI